MQIIPVLDLKDGLVVHAKQGQRNHYQPICSPLCQSSNLQDVIAAYLKLHAFRTFYIADLNAIVGDHSNQTLINKLLGRFSEHAFWIDSGYQAEPAAYQQHPHYHPVLGSESYTNANYSALAAFQNQYVLSLDFSGDTKLGANKLFTPSNVWPNTIIIMNLQRVGLQQGADLAKLSHFVENYPDYHFVAAGGIRTIEDLQALQSIGISTVLLASALHAGTINAHDLQTLTQHKKNGA